VRELYSDWEIFIRLTQFITIGPRYVLSFLVTMPLLLASYFLDFVSYNYYWLFLIAGLLAPSQGERGDSLILLIHFLFLLTTYCLQDF
jgi:hypothetical protein